MSEDAIPVKRIQKIEQDLEEIKDHIKKISSPTEHIISNKKFLTLMDVSMRTAQSWRDAGLIGFTQLGRKIFYRMSDIETFMERYHQEPKKYADKVFE